MPLYDLVCVSCGEEYEVLIPLCLLDEPQRCPKCGELLHRELNSVSLIKVR